MHCDLEFSVFYYVVWFKLMIVYQYLVNCVQCKLELSSYDIYGL